MMANPPMVGVPALEKWPAGPSSRICCPILRARNWAMSKAITALTTLPAATRGRPPQLADGLPGHHGIVKRPHLAAYLLGGLVALARDQDHVPRAGRTDGLGDGLGPVRLHHDLAFPGPARHLPDDGHGVLAAGVVGGQEDDVGQAAGHLP